LKRSRGWLSRERRRRRFVPYYVLRARVGDLVSARVSGQRQSPWDEFDFPVLNLRAPLDRRLLASGPPSWKGNPRHAPTRRQAGIGQTAKIPASETTIARVACKEIQIKSRKIAWISLVFFGRIRTFQRVTREKIKKLVPVHTRAPGCGQRPEILVRVSLGGAPTGFFITDDHIARFCLRQENAGETLKARQRRRTWIDERRT
jgi:hypothetical protein